MTSLKDLVQRVADMRHIGVRRPVMQHEFLAPRETPRGSFL